MAVDRAEIRYGATRRHTLVRGAKTPLRSPLALRAILRDRFYRQHAPHALAVCAIFKDEAKFLDEWIRFHARVGVTRFYLYDNGTRDHEYEVLRVRSQATGSSLCSTGEKGESSAAL